jgi:scyllo-inositol 2-dehydrogenase (NADP+)
MVSTSDANTNQSPLRVGIIGYGLAGTVFHSPLIATTPGMRVAAIVTADPKRQERARADFPDAAIYPTSEALLANPAALDLVVVAAPNRVHVPLAIAALEAGLPVVVDKPVAPSSADAERLIAAARERGQLLSVFQNRRWDSDFLTARRLIQNGSLGAVVRLESRFERFRPAVQSDAWRERPAPAEGGGLLLDLGAHLVDQACQLFGRPVSVYAESDVRRAGATVDDDTFVALRFPGGAVAHLWASVIPRRPGPRLRVVGMRGVFETEHLDPQEDAISHGQRPGDPGWGMPPRGQWGHLTIDLDGLAIEATVEPLPGSYETYYAGMRDAIRSGAPVPVDPADSLLGLRIIEAARESAREGRVVTLPTDGNG